MNQQNEEELKSIELDITVAQGKVRKADLLEKLYKDPAFKELIAEGFLKDYAVRIVHLKAHPNANEVVRASCDVKIDAIGALNSYFQAIFVEGQAADIALGQAEQAREEIEAEDALENEEN